MTQNKTIFTIIFGCIYALGALGIDTILPALPHITAEMATLGSNHAALVISLFVLGMGIGMPLAGPLSDQFGRKPIMLAGVALYLFSAGLGYFAPNLVTLCLARALQGMGASCTSVAATASMRDRFQGPQMASMMSFAMMVFAIVPTIAPYLGQTVMALSSWRAIFVVFMVFAFCLFTAIFTQIIESHAPEKRQQFRFPILLNALREILSMPRVRFAILGLVVVQGMLFSTLSSIQPIFDRFFGSADTFPLWFALVGVSVFGASLFNGKMVKRIGMLRMLKMNLTAQTLFTCSVAALFWLDFLPNAVAFPLYILWTCSLFFVIAGSSGNFIAVAMEPLGHLAGVGSSLITASGMLCGSLISIPVGQAFNGTPKPLLLACAILASLALWQVRRLQAERHGRGHNAIGI